MTTSDVIKLRAEDTEDLAVIAACLQDAIACLAEMDYDPAAQRFALVVKRFRWEDKAATGAAAGLPVVKTGLHFETISGVKLRGLDQHRRSAMLELLTVTSEQSSVGITISLLFAGGGEIRLEAAHVLCRMMDLEAPHPTHLRPRHPLSEEGAP